MAPNTAGVGAGFPRGGVEEEDGRSWRVGVSPPAYPRTTPQNTGKGGKPGKHCLRPRAGTSSKNCACEESPAPGHTRKPMCPALSPGPNSSETALGCRDSQAKVPKAGAGRMDRMSSLPRLGFREVFNPTGTASDGSGTQGTGDETQPPSRTPLSSSTPAAPGVAEQGGRAPRG